MNIALIISIIGCIIWGLAAFIQIVKYLESHGVKINWIWIRALTPKYVSLYRNMTRQENGTVGPLFYHFVIPFFLAFILAILLIIKVR